MKDCLIKCRNLSKHYQKRNAVIAALSHLSMQVARGEFVALMGASGSGKTTLLNLLAAIDTPSDGSLIIDGQELVGASRYALTKWRAKHVGYLFRFCNLVHVLSAIQNVELPLLLTSLSRQERLALALNALARVGLEDRADHMPMELSRLETKRIALARAMVADPPLLVADEPTSDLNWEAAETILQMFRRMSSEEGKTIVMVTHDPRAAGYASRVLQLKDGTIQ